MNSILPPNLQGLSHESRQDRIASFHLKQLVKPMLVEKNMGTGDLGNAPLILINKHGTYLFFGFSTDGP